MTAPDFTIDRTPLAGLPALLDRLGEDARLAGSHLETHTAVAWSGEGLINLLAGGHRAVRERVAAFLAAVDGAVAAPVAAAVRASLAQYSDVEWHNTGVFGAITPDASTPPAPDAPAGPDPFRDVAQPVTRLHPPPDHETRYPHSPHWSDIASPGAVLRDAIWAVTGAAATLGILDRAYDPYEFVLKPVVGDWAAIRGCADVFGQLADATGDMGRNLRHAADTSPPLWTGPAGSQCAAHLDAAARALTQAQHPLRAIAAEYRTAADGMHELRATLASLLNDIADAAIMAAASAAVVALSGSSGVGLPVALVLGAFTLTRVYAVARGVVQLVEAVALGRAAVDAQDAALGGFGRIDAIVPLPVLPAPR